MKKSILRRTVPTPHNIRIINHERQVNEMKTKLMKIVLGACVSACATAMV